MQVAKPRLKEVMDKMVEYCEENRRDVKQGLELLPGVLLLLQCLSRRDDIVFGLVGLLVHISLLNVNVEVKSLSDPFKTRCVLSACTLHCPISVGGTLIGNI